MSSNPGPATPSSTAPSSAPMLRSLSPKFIAESHEYYVGILVQQLEQTGAEAPRNIALTGHYGSGKSSVLGEVQSRMNAPTGRRRGGTVINIALSSLGADEVRIGRVVSEKTPLLTNLIQKEIVKQLLYRESPARMRGSRYRRADVFHHGPAIAWSAVIAGSLAIVALLSGVLGRIQATLPASWSDLGWLPWLVTLALTLAGGLACWFAARALHNRVWIEKLSAGPATVSLQNQTNSYFDEYLDEIVYFFQASGIRIVVFEDLDRFNDPHIFETLRELNTVLNHSRQITHRPIRFVYAIKDSIFEKIASSDAGMDSERLHSAATNRTKFFDLVVPIVPFISHRNASELIRTEFADAAAPPSAQLVEIIAPHLTDMRLVKNLRNEYEIFARHVLPPLGLDGLKADCLLAMLVYKNLHLADFEAVREGKSNLDDVYREYRATVTEVTAAADAEARDARAELNTLDGASQRSAELGERLGQVLDVLLEGSGSPVQMIETSAGSYSRDDLTRTVFWRDWTASRSTIQGLNPQGYSTRPRTFAEMQTLLGVTWSNIHWEEERRADLERKEQTAVERRELASRASLQQLMNDPTVKMRAYVESHLDALTVELIDAGLLLDENFTLYVATFQTGALTLHAMNFVLHSVQRDEADLRFRFNDPSEIDAVAKSEPRRFLLGHAAFNIEVFDHFLSTAPHRLAHAFTTISNGSAEGRALLDAYLLDGQRAPQLIEQLAPIWPGVFKYLHEQRGLEKALSAQLHDVAAGSARANVVYDVDASLHGFFANLVSTSTAFGEPGTAADPAALASLLEAAGVEVEDLSALAPAVRERIVARSLYPVSRSNLRTIIGPKKPLTLEGIKAHDKTVYDHVLQNLDAYISDVLGHKDPTVSRPEFWLGVLADVATVASRFLSPVAERADVALFIDDLTDAEPETWRALAETRRFAASASNLAAYVDKWGVDDALRIYLQHTSAIDRADIGADAATALARALINAAALPPRPLASLIASFKPTGLTVAHLNEAAKPAVPALVQVGLIQQSPENYTFVADQPWSVREELIVVSPDFANHMLVLDLDVNEVRDFAVHATLPAFVRQTLMDNLDAFERRVDRVAARALARWVLRQDYTLELDEIARLARLGADPATTIALLEPLLPSLSASEIAEVLDVLGDPYAALPVTGDRHHVKVPATDPTRRLLKRLQALERVSSFEDDDGGSTLRVRRKGS
ncbi:hypothetical protein ACTHAM_003426 [Cellulomonas soli]|uniref:YobI family P-loop NTPase n=1 Tax=Cellulomonas soli TaxID=931535 RepID=UPI003F835E8C